MRRLMVPGGHLGDEIVLRGDQHHRLGRVLRLRPGDVLEVLDGQGGWARARIDAIDAHTARLETVERGVAPADPAILTLAVAPVKGDACTWMLQKATELGVARFTPLRTARGVVRPRDRTPERWLKVIRGACEQCGRRHLMSVGPAAEVAPAAGAAGRAVLLAPGARAGLEEVLEEGPTDDLAILIGPEGGFTDDEVDAARAAGAAIAGLGDLVLRVETAALAVAVLARRKQGALGG